MRALSGEDSFDGLQWELSVLAATWIDLVSLSVRYHVELYNILTFNSIKGSSEGTNQLKIYLWHEFKSNFINIS